MIRFLIIRFKQRVKKGDNIKSGAEIVEGKVLIEVQEVLEKSMFCEIAKQLNMSQGSCQ